MTYVYFARPLQTDHIHNYWIGADAYAKIGWTGDPESRLGTFNTSSPLPWGGVFWRIRHEPERWEGYLLAMFAKWRLKQDYRDRIGFSEVISTSWINDEHDLVKEAIASAGKSQGECDIMYSWFLSVLEHLQFIGHHCFHVYINNRSVVADQPDTVKNMVLELRRRAYVILPGSSRAYYDTEHSIPQPSRRYYGEVAGA